ncbi:MAG: hypothetical protein WAO52_20935 [Prolixibacteraceae bacterium]
MNTIITTIVTAAVTYSTVTVPATSFESWYDEYNRNLTQEIKYEPSIEESDSKSEVGNEKFNYLYVNPVLHKFILHQPECYKPKKSFTFHYLYFYSSIWYLNNVDRRYGGKDYANIHRKTITEIISRDIYDELVSNSIKWNIIEENPYKKYQVGWFSKSYRLKEPFGINVQRFIIEDRLINRKINEHKMSLKKEIKHQPLPYQYLSMTNTFIDMDIASATQLNKVKYLIHEPKKYDSNFYSISEYDDGNYRFSVDEFGNRAHTNLTNLSTELRQFLTVEGEPLAQIDISNSQPLFFYLHLKDLTDIPQSEKDKYRDIVETGKFYEFFMSKLNISFEKRGKFKHKILASIFFDKYRRKESRYIKVFKQDFPSISAYIKKLRMKDYKTLARVLQQTESKFVIEGIVAEFIKYFGDSNEFISTIHDSVVVKTVSIR